MCKYQYKSGALENKFCVYPNYYNDLKTLNASDHYDKDYFLPIDEDGFCIFHSNNIEWKRENNFVRMFFDLVNLLNQTEPDHKNKHGQLLRLNFAGFVFVSAIENADFVFDGLNHHSEIGILNNSQNQHLQRQNDTGFSSQIRFTFLGLPDFRNSVFHETLRINNVNFKIGCDFRDSRFLKDFRIIETVFSESSFLDNIIVESNFYCLNSTFIGAVSFANSIFKSNFAISEDPKFFKNRANMNEKERFSFSGDFVELDKISFGNEKSWTKFENLTFKDYTPVNFTESKFEGLVIFREIAFNDYVNFINSEFNLLTNNDPTNSSVSFTQIKIGNGALIKFKGSKPFFNMFKNDVYFHFKEDFDGLISFTNVNFDNIDKKSEKLLLKMKEAGLVSIGNGCIKNQMNIINVFIASQSILEPERAFIATKIHEKNIYFVTMNKNIYLVPIRWEHRDKGNDGRRKQDEYNDLISNSETFILLLWNSIGKYTEEEYRFALNERKNGKNPQRIYVFNKIDNTNFDDKYKDDKFLDLLKDIRKDEIHVFDFYNVDSLSEELHRMYDFIEERYNN